jgi:hypothetical protein
MTKEYQEASDAYLKVCFFLFSAWIHAVSCTVKTDKSRPIYTGEERRAYYRYLCRRLQGWFHGPEQACRQVEVYTPHFSTAVDFHIPSCRLERRCRFSQRQSIFGAMLDRSNQGKKKMAPFWPFHYLHYSSVLLCVQRLVHSPVSLLLSVVLFKEYNFGYLQRAERESLAARICVL